MNYIIQFYLSGNGEQLSVFLCVTLMHLPLFLSWKGKDPERENASESEVLQLIAVTEWHTGTDLILSQSAVRLAPGDITSLWITKN